MLSHDLKTDVEIDVKNRVAEWVGLYLSIGLVDNRFETLFKIFKSVKFDLSDLFGMNARQVLEATREACKTLAFSEFDTDCALQNWACDAHEYLKQS